MGSATEAVLAAAERRADALARRDWPALERELHPEFRYVNAEGRRLSRDDCLAFVSDGAFRWNEQRLEDVQVTIVGTTAVLTAEVHDDVQLGDERHELVFVSTQTYVLDEGRWLYLAGQTGPIRA
jgi:Domain of unknown function (DUF4440)